MAFMSGTLESLLFTHHQSKDGEPVSSKILVSRASDTMYSSPHCSQASSVTVVPSISQQASIGGPVQQTCIGGPDQQTCIRGPVQQTCIGGQLQQTGRQVQQTCIREPVQQTCIREPVQQTCIREPVQQTCIRGPVEQSRSGSQGDSPCNRGQMTSNVTMIDHNWPSPSTRKFTATSAGRDTSEMLCDTSEGSWQSMPAFMDSNQTEERVLATAKCCVKAPPPTSPDHAWEMPSEPEAGSSTQNKADSTKEITGEGEGIELTKEPVPSENAESKVIPGASYPTLKTAIRPGESTSNSTSSNMLNDECFQAAVSEGFNYSVQPLSFKVRPRKRFSYHVHNKLMGTKSHGMEKSSMADLNFIACEDLVKMSLPDTVSQSSISADSQDDSDTSSQSSRKDIFDKKFRYNHTALALQQSGLMKTTIKTGEMLRRGRILQAELNKLGKETTLLMRSVLSNPENQHIRELFTKLHQHKLLN